MSQPQADDQQQYNAVFQDIQQTLKNDSRSDNSDQQNFKTPAKSQNTFTEKAKPDSVIHQPESSKNVPFSSRSANPTSQIENSEMAVLKETNHRLKLKLIEMVKIIDQKTTGSEQNIMGSKNDESKQIKVYKDMLLQRDQIVQNQNQKIESLLNEIEMMKSGGKNNEVGIGDLDQMKYQLKTLGEQNDNYKKENSTLKKIQLGQAKALQQISNDGEYPIRMKSLIDELKGSKDSYHKLQYKYETLDKNSKQNSEHMAKLNLAVRDLKVKLMRKNAVYEDDIEEQNQYQQEQIGELSRATKILSRSKDKDAKLLRMQKKIFDKSLQEQNLKHQKLQNIIKEKDKEIKLQAIKLKELMNVDRATRQKIIKRDYAILQQLSQPNQHANAVQSQQNLSKLEQKHNLNLQYGRIHPSMGMKSKIMQSQQEQSMLPKLDPLGSHSANSIDYSGSSRSRSVNPGSKKQKMKIMDDQQQQNRLVNIYNTQNPSYNEIKRNNEQILQDRLKTIDKSQGSYNPNPKSVFITESSTNQSQLEQVQEQIQQADLELGKSEALIEKAANQILQKKQSLVSYDPNDIDASSLQIANLQLDKSPGQAMQIDQLSQENDNFESYNFDNVDHHNKQLQVAKDPYSNLAINENARNSNSRNGALNSNDITFQDNMVKARDY